MTIINRNLIERLHAIHDAYAHGLYSRMTITNPNYPVTETDAAQPPKAAGHWRDALPKDDEDDEGGGRGSAKGLRGKDAEYAKQAMRKLSRNR